MDDAQKHRSHLFVVRLWLEPLASNEREARGHVRHVLSGETHYFRTYTGLIGWLASYLHSTEERSGTREE